MKKGFVIFCYQMIFILQSKRIRDMKPPLILNLYFRFILISYLIYHVLHKVPVLN